MEQDMEYRQKQVKEYRRAVKPLLRYLPWLEQSAGKKASSIYNGQDIGEHSVTFPVYDGTLMSFIREASRTSLMDRNYKYVYTRNHLNTHEDERRLIEKAGIKEWDLLRGILSKYVLGGMTKSVLWNQGMEERLFYLTVNKMREILEFWDKTLDDRGQ